MRAAREPDPLAGRPWGPGRRSCRRGAAGPSLGRARRPGVGHGAGGGCARGQRLGDPDACHAHRGLGRTAGPDHHRPGRRYKFSDLFASHVKIQVRAPSFSGLASTYWPDAYSFASAGTLRVASSGSTADVDLPVSASISGRVVDADTGDPIVGARSWSPMWMPRPAGSRLDRRGSLRGPGSS